MALSHVAWNGPATHEQLVELARLREAYVDCGLRETVIEAYEKAGAPQLDSELTRIKALLLLVGLRDPDRLIS